MVRAKFENWSIRIKNESSTGTANSSKSVDIHFLCKWGGICTSESCYEYRIHKSLCESADKINDMCTDIVYSYLRKWRTNEYSHTSVVVTQRITRVVY